MEEEHACRSVKRTLDEMYVTADKSDQDHILKHPWLHLECFSIERSAELRGSLKSGFAVIARE